MEGKMKYMKPAVGSMEDFHGFLGFIFAVFAAASAVVAAVATSAATQMNQAAAQRRAANARVRRAYGFLLR